MPSSSSSIFTRLIYLWAFVEGILGGMIHLFHLPVSGFIIGGFSVAINSTIAKFSKPDFRTWLLGLGLVLAAKFMLSPYSPVGAYIAVGFQGIAAIVIYSVLGVNRVSVYGYSILVMLESAAQKPLMAYLILGKQWFDELIAVSHSFFGSFASEVFIKVSVIAYLLLYLIVGVLVAAATVHIIKTITSYQLPESFFESRTSLEILTSQKGGGNIKNTFVGIFIFIILTFCFFYTDWKLILKLCFGLFLYLILLPYLLRLCLRRFIAKHDGALSGIVHSLPEIKDNIVRSHHFTKILNGWPRLRQFVFLSIYSNVFHHE